MSHDLPDAASRAEPTAALPETSRVDRSLERERTLRALLFSARDALVRERLAADIANRPQSERAAAPTGGPSDTRRPFAAATIISRNYLSQARVLATTFLRHEPASRFYLLVVDRLPDGVELGVDATVIDPAELAIAGFHEMCFKYGIVEFNTAVKPHLLSLLFERYGEDEVVYFDPDIWIQRPLNELRSALATASIVLTPHITRPLPLDGKRPSEQDIMISGAFNLGFLGLRRCPETSEFLAWWQERLRDGCRIDVAQGLFTDQKWIDLVPGMFPRATILRDPAYNVAFWNLHERALARDGDRFLVNGRPAAFFHVSGFDPELPGKLSKHQTRLEVEPGTPLAELLERYAALLLEHGHRETSAWEYGYARFANGVRVHPLLRQIYLHLDGEQRARFGDPFAADGPGSFLEWATRPSSEDGGLSPFLRSVHRARYDLPVAFPDVRGRDRDAFLRWARRWGSAEMKFEPELVRDDGGHDGRNGGHTAPASQATATAKGNGGGRAGESRGARRAAPKFGRHTDGGGTSYEVLIRRIRELVRSALPAGSRVLVVSRGDYRLLDLGGCEGAHFPQAENGVYGGYHPPDSDAAIAHLEALRCSGADYLLVPQTALWWLEFYDGFRQHLESRCRLVAGSPEVCLVFALHEGRRQPTAARGELTAAAGGPR